MGEALITRRGGKVRPPNIFGDGSDGDLHIAAGETVVLPVMVPHQSVVEKQYKSIVIEKGAVLKCSDPNAGLVLRCRGDCTIYGTIDQSLMAPKMNPNNNYLYPAELCGGDGGNGGGGGSVSGYGAIPGEGGMAMLARKFGGGYGSGGGGGVCRPGAGGETLNGGNGGGFANITIQTTDILFIGGKSKQGLPKNGILGGGGGGGSYGSGGGKTGGDGGNAAGADGETSAPSGVMGGGGGGAGNVGGGVVMFYLGGALKIEGSVLCYGGNGGNGGVRPYADYTQGGMGGGGGGGGGGAIYIIYNTIQTITGSLDVNGGVGGTGAGSGQAGAIGTVTIKKYERGMTV